MVYHINHKYVVYLVCLSYHSLQQLAHYTLFVYIFHAAIVFP